MGITAGWTAKTAGWTAKTAAAKALLQKALGQRGQPRGHYAEDVGIGSIDEEGGNIKAFT
jgi:hypothetical protein